MDALREPALLRAPSPSRTGGVGAFRSEACGAFTQLPDAPRWQGFEDGDRRVLDWLEISSPLWAGPEGPPRVACLVYSFHQNRQHLRDSFAVWAQDCDVFLPFSDEVWEDHAGGYQTIEVHPGADGAEAYEEIIGKLRAAFQEVARRLATGALEFDFLAVSPDDSFWIVPNLRRLLHEVPRAGAAVYLGHRLAVDGSPYRIYAGGGGYVLNRLALRAYLSCPTPDRQHGFAEDVIMAECLARQGIHAIPTEDLRGAQRFHLGSPAATLGLNLSAMSASPEAQWLHTFHKPWQVDLASGLRGIARTSVLFHGLSGQRRYDLHDWLYRRHCVSTITTSTAARPAASMRLPAQLPTQPTTAMPQTWLLHHFEDSAAAFEGAEGKRRMLQPPAELAAASR